MLLGGSPAIVPGGAGPIEFASEEDPPYGQGDSLGLLSAWSHSATRTQGHFGRPKRLGVRERTLGGACTGGLLVTACGRAWNPLMTRDQVLQRLAGARAELAALGVRSLDLFGSVARGESGPDSDVDLLVDFDRPIGLFHFFRVQHRIEEILGSKVDLVMRDAVKRQLRDRIFAEAVRAT